MMRDHFLNACTLLLLAVVFWPWVLGVVDGGAWLLIGQQLSAVPWGGERGALLITWPIWWVLALLFFGTVLGGLL